MNDNNDQDNVNGYHNNNGKFAPGNPGKPKGSSKNKLRDEIKTFLNDNWKNFPEWFSKLKEKEKIQVMLDLLPYAVSRLQSVAMTDSEGNDFSGSPIDFSRLSDDDLKTIIAIQNKVYGTN
ncbi:MAG: hypothetical protein IT234_04625 [Bacteroidia bacterium]|nr:hypothetical protein [Bacteroidia bacterium]